MKPHPGADTAASSIAGQDELYPVRNDAGELLGYIDCPPAEFRTSLLAACRRAGIELLDDQQAAEKAA